MDWGATAMADFREPKDNFIGRGLLINIAIPSLAAIKEMEDVNRLDDLLTSALTQSVSLAIYVKALVERGRELRQ